MVAKNSHVIRKQQDMKVEVNLYASLSRYAPDGGGGKGLVMEVSEGTRISDLLAQLGVPGHEVKIIFLNATHSSAETTLKDGDRLGVFPPVAGG